MDAQQHNGHATAPERDTEEGGALDFSSFMGGFAADVKSYVNAQQRYLAMHATDKVSGLMGGAVQRVMVFTGMAMTVLFLNVALALYLGDLLASRPLGFVLVAGLCLLLVGIFLLWWSNGGKDRFILQRINELNDEN